MSFARIRSFVVSVAAALGIAALALAVLGPANAPLPKATEGARMLRAALRSAGINDTVTVKDASGESIGKNATTDSDGAATRSDAGGPGKAGTADAEAESGDSKKKTKGADVNDGLIKDVNGTNASDAGVNDTGGASDADVKAKGRASDVDANGTAKVANVDANDTAKASDGDRVQTLSGGNPFSGGVFYVNPTYSQSLNSSINTAADVQIKRTLESMQGVPSAYWLDTKDKIKGSGPRTMQGILTDAASKSPPELVTLIVYDLPNRDCHAKASNGEVCCTYKSDGKCDYFAAGTCADGIDEYKKEYITPIVEVLKEFDGRVPIVLVIEPDSLPNLSTNRADARCGNSATVAAYKEGVSYAVKAIAEATADVAIYLDAGHGGWLGWNDNMNDFVQTIKDLEVADHLRGFATNVAGYQPLGVMCTTFDYCLNNAHPEAECCYDPCGLVQEWNPSQNELNYALHLKKSMSEGIPGFTPHMIIDTGRNGVADMRGDCANWCNIRGAGVGHKPTVNTADASIVDAYYWLKTPGESDGCTQTLPDGGQCARFDADCGSPDSIGSKAYEPRAPEAGQWFDYQVKQLAAFADMGGEQ